MGQTRPTGIDPSNERQARQPPATETATHICIRTCRGWSLDARTARVSPPLLACWLAAWLGPAAAILNR